MIWSYFEFCERWKGSCCKVAERGKGRDAILTLLTSFLIVNFMKWNDCRCRVGFSQEENLVIHREFPNFWWTMWRAGCRDNVERRAQGWAPAPSLPPERCDTVAQLFKLSLILFSHLSSIRIMPELSIAHWRTQNSFVFVRYSSSQMQIFCTLWKNPANIHGALFLWTHSCCPWWPPCWTLPLKAVLCGERPWWVGHKEPWPVCNSFVFAIGKQRA